MDKMTLVEQIQVAEESLRQAMLASDVNALSELIADDLLFTGPAGRLVSKATDLENYRSGLQKMIALTPHEQSIRPFGETVIVSVQMEVEGQFAGQSFQGRYQYGRVWINTAGNWKIVAGHVSLVQSE